MFDELFIRKTLNIEKALLFGFVKDNNDYRYEVDILDELFRLQVAILSDGSVNTILTEIETGEEYVLYKTNSAGSFVGEVRKAVGAFLAQVAENCYDPETFKTLQSKQLIDYVKANYGDKLEFLWKKFPDNAIWRRKDTGKWYGAILTVAKNKLGLDSDEIIEIIDLRISPDKLETLLLEEGYFPGWHMNKKNWYTIILDGSVAIEEIYSRVDESYRLAV